MYHESNKIEEWETTLREEADSESYQLDDGLKGVSSDSLNHMSSVQELLNNGENHISLANYKNRVQTLLGLENNLPVIPEDAWIKQIAQLHVFMGFTSKGNVSAELSTFSHWTG